MFIDVNGNDIEAAAPSSVKFGTAVCLLDLKYTNTNPRASALIGVHLGYIDIFRYETRVFRRGWRDIQQIRTDNIDDYLINLPVNAEAQVTQSGTHSTVTPGSLAVLSTSKPFKTMCAPSYVEYLVKVSGALLRQRVPQFDDFCGHAIKLHPGSGTVLKSLLDIILKEGGILSESYAQQLALIVLDSIVEATANAPEFRPAHSLRYRSTFERIRENATRYIESHLSDPALAVGEIAKHCQVSKRYLQSAFSEISTTVHHCIRAKRLSRCRDALRSVAMQSRSVYEIALMWGFNDPAHFSHCYKAHFGVTASSERLSSMNSPDSLAHAGEKSGS